MDPHLYQLHHGNFREDLSFWKIELAGLDPVLDLGCGTGRVTFPLARAGHRVWGVDRDPGMLEHARAALAAEPEDIRSRVSFVEADMVHYSPDLRFGAVISTCNTYSTLTDGDRRILLNNLSSLILPGGILAFSVPNPALLGSVSGDDTPQEEDSYYHPDTGQPVIVSSQIITEQDAVGWEWIYDILEPDGRVTRKKVQSLHSRADRDTYRKELSRSGWTILGEFGDFDRSGWNRTSPFYIVVASTNRSRRFPR